MQKKWKYRVVFFLLSICLFSHMVPAASASAVTTYFSDINGWYREAIEYNVKLGIFHGTDRHIFSPNAPMTQAMVVAVLCRLGEVYTLGESLGDNIYGKIWYDRYENWALGAQIHPKPESSYPQPPDSGESFIVYKTVTREEFAVYLCNFLDYLDIKPPELPGWLVNASGWSDYNNPYPLMESGLDPICYPSQWAWPSYGGLREAGIINGYPGNKDFPGAVITRAEACQMLMRVCEEYLFPNYDELVDPIDQTFAYLTVIKDMASTYIPKYLALDLTGISFLSDIEPLVALVKDFCDEKGCILLLDTVDGLIENGYVIISNEYGEYFAEGYLIRLIDIQLTSHALVANAIYWMGDLVGCCERYTVRKINGSWKITGNLIIWLS